ncbi:MAG: hypothetical protein EXS34_03935 [Lacunisphaera sp.]|nr:hypothetical protein [Lacunisphaera sp.]
MIGRCSGARRVKCANCPTVPRLPVVRRSSAN